MGGIGVMMAFGIGSMCLGATFLLTCLFALLGRNGGIEGRAEGILGAFICMAGLGITALFYFVALTA